MSERQTTVVLVDFENNNFDFCAELSEFRRMLNLLGPAEVRDVDQAVNALLDFNKYTEVGEVANLGSVLRADGIAYFDIFPGILLKLLDAKRHLALVAVEGEDYGLYLVAYLHEVLSAAEVLAPRHFAYVDTKDGEGHALVPEVCICFDNMLMRGNRTTKVNSDNFRAFRSENLPPLAEAGISIRYNTSLIRKPEDWSRPLTLHKDLDTRVSILKIHPGITPQVVRNILLGDQTRAVILETYGSGNAPCKEWFISIVKEAAKSGKILLNVTQCLGGSVNMDIYANGKTLKEAGVLNARLESVELR